MSKQDEVLLESAVKSQHETIMQGGKIEEFAEALGRFCRVEGWKKLKDENATPFRSLRHYIEAKPPFGAGYPGKVGLEKIEAYLSLTPRVKDFFQHCHANCLYDMAKEEGVSPLVVSKREWNDVMGAKLAKAIEVNPKEVYEEKAAAYLENKERVKPASREKSESAPVRMSYRRNYPYAFAKKIKEIFSPDDLELLKVALRENHLSELVEFERSFNKALSAFLKSKTETGWGAGEVKAPEQYQKRTPRIEHSKWVDGEAGGNNLLSLCDEDGELVVVRMNATNGVDALSFKKQTSS